MADEITLGASLSYLDSEMDEAIEISLSALLASVSTKKFTRVKQNVGTSEEAMVLGEVTSLGWLLIVNRDATNFVEWRTATGAGNDAIKIPARRFALFHVGSDVTAPFLIANTAACQVEIFLISQ
jgi:hypothetical protein